MMAETPKRKRGRPKKVKFEDRYEIIDTHMADNKILYILYNKKEEHKLFHCMTWERGAVIWCNPVRVVK